MKGFQNWLDQNKLISEKYNITAAGTRQGLAADRREFGINWKGPQEVKELIELIARHNDKQAMALVNRIKIEASKLKNIIQQSIDSGQGNEEDLSKLESLVSTVRVDMRRYVNRDARNQKMQNKNVGGPNKNQANQANNLNQGAQQQ